jgi:hypothetical protein
MKALSTTILLLLLFISSYAQQKLTLGYIDTVLVTDTAYRPASEMFYLVDGEVYARPSAELVVALSKISADRVMDILMSKRIPMDCWGADFVIVTSFGNQKRKTKVKCLKTAKSAFEDIYSDFSQHILINSKDPVLYINDHPVSHTECSNVVKKLNVGDIKNISVYLWPFSESYWGRNAKNGIVRIWTYNKTD